MARAGAFLFGAAEIALLAAPVIVAITWLRSRRRSGPLRVSVFWMVIPAVFAVAAASLDTSFVDVRVNAVFLAVAYAGYCVVVGVLLARPKTALAFSFGMVLTGPVLLGLLLGTGGVPAVGLIAAEYEPKVAGELSERHRYVVTRLGNVYSPDAGWSVGIYRRVRLVPILQRRVFLRRYVATDSSDVRVEEQPGFHGAFVRISGQPPTVVPFD